MGLRWDQRWVTHRRERTSSFAQDVDDMDGALCCPVSPALLDNFTRCQVMDVAPPNGEFPNMLQSHLPGI